MDHGVHLRKSDFAKLGYTRNCLKCTALRAGSKSHGTVAHTPECRARMTREIQSNGSDLQRARLEEAERRVNERIATEIEEQCGAEDER